MRYPLWAVRSWPRVRPPVVDHVLSPGPVVFSLQYVGECSALIEVAFCPCVVGPLLSNQLRFLHRRLLARFKKTLSSSKQNLQVFCFMFIDLKCIDLVLYGVLQTIKKDHHLVDECFSEDLIFKLKLHERKLL
jgi:hypothetical protein